MRTNLVRYFVAAAITLLAGCHVEPEALESLRDIVHTVAEQTPSASRNDSGDGLAGATFDPPHPDRTDPFSFPSDAPVADNPGTSITTVAQVRVLGFAQVDEPRVFLRTKDTTKSLAIGDATDGVEVIAINPPAVDLRMGSLIWTATMFDNTSVVRD